jgi:hypothetical protein
MQLPKHLSIRLLFSISSVFFLFATLFFIFNQPRPLGDEPEHFVEIQNYVVNGITLKALQNHATESGVISYIYQALIGKILGENLEGFRLGNWLCWLIALGYIGWKNREFDNIVFATLFTLTNTYCFTLAANIYNETQAISLLVVGCFAFWHHYQRPRWWLLVIGLGAFGLLPLTRFYAMAAIPALGLTIWYLWAYTKRDYQETFKKTLWLLFALVPLLCLIYLWNGITPPKFYERYPQFVSEIGIGFQRPLQAIAMIGVYIFPLLISDKSYRVFKPNVFIYGLALVMAFYWSEGNYLWNFKDSFSNSGLIDHALGFLSAKNHLTGQIANFVLVFIGFYSFCIFVKTIFQHLHQLRLHFFWIAYILFYIIEQCFVSATVPFFERYLFMIFPALGFLIYEYILKRKLSIIPLMYLALSFLLSAFSLYRFF